MSMFDAADYFEWDTASGCGDDGYYERNSEYFGRRSYYSETDHDFYHMEIVIDKIIKHCQKGCIVDTGDIKHVFIPYKILRGDIVEGETILVHKETFDLIIAEQDPLEKYKHLLEIQ